MMRFAGSRPGVEPQGAGQHEATARLYLGNDPAQWREDIPLYNQIIYPQIYAGVDLVYTAQSNGLKSEFRVAPGISPDVIVVHYEGGISLTLAEEGTLEAALGNETILQEYIPAAYQIIEGDEVPVSISYRLIDEQTYTFTTDEPLNPAAPLIIDPLLIHSSFFGGTEQDEGWAATADKEGNTIITGITESPDLFGLSQVGASESAQDIFVAKFAPDGQLIYVTVIGGSGSEEGNCIDSDDFGNVYVAGETMSRDFPVRNAWQPTPDLAENACLLKLTAEGSLDYSTYLGGSVAEEVNDIFVDSVGNTYIGGEVYSDDFPLMNPWSDDVFGGEDEDGFISIFTPNGQMIYSTYISAPQRDQVFRLTVDNEGYVYAAGMTSSPSFPTRNAFQSYYAGGWDDCYILKLDPWNNRLIYSSFLGGMYTDECWGLAVDDEGNAYVAGHTTSQNFRLASPIQPTYGGGPYDAFVAKISPHGNQLIYSSFIGGSGDDRATDLAIDSGGNVYITGRTSSAQDFPLAQSIQSTYGGGEADAFILQLDPAGTIQHASFFGGARDDFGFGLDVDDDWILHLTGTTYSPNFPTLSTFPYYSGESDAFVAQVGLVPTPTPTPTPTPFASDQIGTAGGALWMTYPEHITMLTVGPGSLTTTTTFTITYSKRPGNQGENLLGVNHFFALDSDPALPQSPLPQLELFLGFNQPYDALVTPPMLYRLSTGMWVTDGITLAERGSNYLITYVHQTGDYGVMGATLRHYLPLLVRSH
jgi:hypothetical protein